MIKYREIFLNKIKLLLPYFVGFFDNKSILPKVYSDNYVGNRSDQTPIIIIIYDKSIFPINDSCQKVRTLEGHSILRPKGKEKGIIMSDFLLP